MSIIDQELVPLGPRTSKLAFSIREAAAATGLSRSGLYVAIQRGHLRTRKIGRRTVILTEDLTGFLRAAPIGGDA